MLQVGRRWMMVWRKRIVGSLAQHIVTTTSIRLGQRLLAHGRPSLISSVIHMRMRELWAALLWRHVASVRSRRRRDRRHAVPRHERLRLWVESVPVEAARNGVLAFGVVRINVGRKGAIGIRNSARWWRRSRPGLVRALVEAWWRRRRRLPCMRLWSWRLHGRAVRPRRDAGHWGLITRLTGRLGILESRQYETSTNETGMA